MPATKHVVKLMPINPRAAKLREKEVAQEALPDISALLNKQCMSLLPGPDDRPEDLVTLMIMSWGGAQSSLGNQTNCYARKAPPPLEGAAQGNR